MNRGTGRTTKMILKAILCFLEGNNVVVTAYSHNYAIDLMKKAWAILNVSIVGYVDRDYNRGLISFNGKNMKFMSHEEWYREGQKFQSEAKNVVVFEDHYFEIMHIQH